MGKNSRTFEIRGMLVSRFGLLGFEVRMVGLEIATLWCANSSQPFLSYSLIALLVLAFCLFSVTHFSFWIDLCMYVTAPLQFGFRLLCVLYTATAHDHA